MSVPTRPPGSRPPEDAPDPASIVGGPAKPGPDDATVLDPAATRRGLIVIGVTILVGAIVFYQGVHRPAEQLQAAPATTAVAATSVVPTTFVAPTTTVAPPVTKLAPKDTPIVVANGVDKARAIAGPLVAKLKGAGYDTTRPADLPVPSDKSHIYAGPELREEARGVARALGWDDTLVALLPEPAPLTMGVAKVLVVVGRDKG